MYKSICVVAVLLAMFAFISGSKPAGASSPTSYASPQIVARGKLLNQTAPIPITTILTPSQNGLYRLSAYATITTPASTYGGFWEYNFMWTDDSGIPGTGGNSVLYAGSGNTTRGPFTWNGVAGFGPAIIFEAKAGVPIAYSVTLFGTPDNSAYSLYYTLERLE
jgi:hypothetical protein